MLQRIRPLARAASSRASISTSRSPWSTAARIAGSSRSSAWFSSSRFSARVRRIAWAPSPAIWWSQSATSWATVIDGKVDGVHLVRDAGDDRLPVGRVDPTGRRAGDHDPDADDEDDHDEQPDPRDPADRARAGGVPGTKASRTSCAGRRPPSGAPARAGRASDERHRRGRARSAARPWCPTRRPVAR